VQKKQKCGTKRTPDSTYSDVYKCKLGWSKDHSGGIDSGGKFLKNMPFVDKNGAEGFFCEREDSRQWSLA
jgi:hypothetical protein